MSADDPDRADTVWLDPSDDPDVVGAALQAAYASLAHGGLVYLREGCYAMNVPLCPPPGILIIGGVTSSTRHAGDT